MPLQVGGLMAAALLEGPRLAPAAGGAPRQLVVFLHGYGADGNDLIGLGREWSRLLPHAAFVSPHAPQPCGMAPMGKQWFNLSLGDPSQIALGVTEAGPSLDAFLDAELASHGLPSTAMALVGFSQGTMMALSVGLRRQPPLAAILGYSGALAGIDGIAATPGSAPSVLLVHGDMDEVIPVEAMMIARAQLAELGLPVQWHISSGIGHGIDPEGLALGGTFLKDAFAAAS